MIRHIVLTLDRSNEYPSDMLLPRSPAVSDTRRVPGAPCPTRHRTDVSDSHSVPSHPVCPDRTIAVIPTSPRLDPCTVTDADPVPALFALRVMLSPAMSTDHT